MGDQSLAPWGNATTHNLESVLLAQIASSRYSAGLDSYEFNDLVDEIYNQVTHVEPWMSGNARGPSTAFCILKRLFELRLTSRQLRTLLQHPDSPYIRAIGFLYLRYVGEPRSLWEWFQEFLRDSEEFAPASDGKTVSLGLYCRELLLDQFYFETLFPRIPEVVSRQIKEGLARLGFATAAVGGAGTGASRRGSQAADEGPSRRPPSVKAALSVSLGQRAPHVAHVREAGRGYANVEPGGKERARSPARQPEARDRERDRDRDRDRERSRERRRERERERSRSRSPGRDDHSKHRRHHRSRSRERRRERSRSRSRGRDARDVFRARPAPAVDPSTLKDRY